MSKKLLDTFVRISTSTRAKLNAHCRKHNLQQGRFADAAILTTIGNHTAETEFNNDRKARRKAAAAK